jgi:tetratricopeptide (TPR) repeat protein
MLYRSLGELEMYLGDYEMAHHYLEASIEISRQQSATTINLWASLILGHLYLREGNGRRAREILVKSCRDFKTGSTLIGVIYALEGLAMIALNENHLEKAVQLLAWVEAARQRINNPRPPIEEKYLGPKQADLRARLDETRHAAAQAAGAALSTEEAMALAFEN